MKRFLLLVCLLSAFLLSGCQRNSHAGAGYNDKVNGFLFVSDTRAVTQALVKVMDAGDLPESVSWLYDDGKHKPVTSTDPDMIRAVFNALSNLIIVGQTTERVSVDQHYISFRLKDGTETRFDFETQNYIHIGDQNYLVESDGNLWSLLKENSPLKEN